MNKPTLTRPCNLTPSLPPLPVVIWVLGIRIRQLKAAPALTRVEKLAVILAGAELLHADGAGIYFTAVVNVGDLLPVLAIRRRVPGGGKDAIFEPRNLPFIGKGWDDRCYGVC